MKSRIEDSENPSGKPEILIPEKPENYLDVKLPKNHFLFYKPTSYYNIYNDIL